MESKENVFFDRIIFSMLGEEEIRDEILKPESQTFENSFMRKREQKGTRN